MGKALLAPPPAAAGGASWQGCPTSCRLPSALNTRDCSMFLSVSGTPALTASYTGAGLHPNDCGGVQADAPVPGDLAVYYYELTVLSRGEKGTIGAWQRSDCGSVLRFSARAECVLSAPTPAHSPRRLQASASPPRSSTCADSPDGSAAAWAGTETTACALAETGEASLTAQRSETETWWALA